MPVPISYTENKDICQHSLRLVAISCLCGVLVSPVFALILIPPARWDTVWLSVSLFTSLSCLVMALLFWLGSSIAKRMGR